MNETGAPGDSIDETLRRRFESAWIEGRPEPIDRFLPPEDHASYLPTLEELVHIELELAWKSWSKDVERAETTRRSQAASSPSRVEAYLERFPRLNQPEVVLRLLQQERFVRRQAGEIAPIEEYRERYPDLVVAGGRFECLLRTVGFGDVDGGRGDTQVAAFPGGALSGDTLPRKFGSYELLEEIGRGGMGVVYRARQCTADRIVALKVIRRDHIESLPRDTRTSALERFRHEAHAAARLEHENIVTVYEVGDVEGEPFFSMQLVEGRTLTEILRDGPIPNRRAAAYVEPVARAVEEAHAQGILHRDLKPQNILVETKSDRPLVADFGLAKLSESKEELTRAGEIMGSPPYMSPEQALDSSRVDAQTDVYALGATLYHVLGGRPPFQAASGLETLRQVIDQEPVPPRQLNPSIDRDLETICLKCLQKEPSRRYASAGSLADDLRRYLNGEPIQARPIGPLQRTVRWCRRNPAVAALIGSTFTFLALALVASIVGYTRTSAALREAEAGYRYARDTVDNFFTQVSEDTLLNRPGMQPLRHELLRQALDYYQRFVAERGQDPALQDELGRTYFRIGRITEQIDSPDAALPTYYRALAMQRRLLLQTPDDPERLEALGNTLNAIGGVLFRQGKWDEARDTHEEAVAIRSQLARSAPAEADLQRKLANSYMNLALVEQQSGHPQQARSQFARAQSLREQILQEHPGDPETRRDLGMGHYNLANLALSSPTPDYDEAKRNFERSIAIFEELLESDPEDLNNQYRLVVCCRLLGDLECAMEHWPAALSLYQRALDRMSALAASNPNVSEYQASLARLHMNLGVLHRDQQRPEEAIASFQRAEVILDVLVSDCPEVPLYRRDLAVTLWEHARLKSDAGERAPAEEAIEAARRHLAILVDQFPEDEEFRALLDDLTAPAPDADSAEEERERE